MSIIIDCSCKTFREAQNIRPFIKSPKTPFATLHKPYILESHWRVEVWSAEWKLLILKPLYSNIPGIDHLLQCSVMQIILSTGNLLDEHYQNVHLDTWWYSGSCLLGRSRTSFSTMCTWKGIGYGPVGKHYYTTGALFPLNIYWILIYIRVLKCILAKFKCTGLQV